MDSLGLSTISVGVPVTVTVVQAPRGFRVWLTHNTEWVIGGAVLLAGIPLVLVLVKAIQARRKSKPGRMTRQGKTDPLTQPIPPRMETGVQRPNRKQRQKNTSASLLRLGRDGQPVTSAPIPLGNKVTFGTEPTKAEIILDDASVSPLHASIFQGADGHFYVRDEKSVAGTWVNHDSVKDDPRRLEHGDVLHFGQPSYRFMLRKPPQHSQPKVISLKE
jgi:hypothetical protein